MRTLGCKVDNETGEAFSRWCGTQNTNVNEALTNLIRQVLDRKMKLKPTGLESRALFCPECGYLTELIQNDEKFYFWCPRCDWCAYIGKFSFPKNVQDWRKKIKEVLRWE